MLNLASWIFRPLCRSLTKHVRTNYRNGKDKKKEEDYLTEFLMVPKSLSFTDLLLFWSLPLISSTTSSGMVPRAKTVQMSE